ncbi:MAG: riboflavin synthase [Bacteroidales bacterium]|nr:riboflavin synthase [Bacteroidales bacterium]
MFTGIIEEIGIIKSIVRSGISAKIIIGAKKILSDLKPGDSISTNGVCLTITDINSNSFTMDVMDETFRRTNLNDLNPGSKVNLERALKLNDRLGGHLVNGHIDGIGIVKEITKENNAIWVSISAEKENLKYIINKGSITVDGISLTVAHIDDKLFKVSIIPFTQEETILTDKKIGEKVNLECDIIGKYIEKLLYFKNNSEEIKKPEKKLDINFLKEHGFFE